MENLEDLYKTIEKDTSLGMHEILPADINKDIGHFNVFSVKELMQRTKKKPIRPYDKRTYYKINLINGRVRTEYADKVIDIEHKALLFASPKIPYSWCPKDLNQEGYFCVFTSDFLNSNRNNVGLDSLPIFKPGGYPVFFLSDDEADGVELIFKKMQAEIGSYYPYKYDLIRNYMLELIHFGQKLQPSTTSYIPNKSLERVSSLFIELLERQFPINSRNQQLQLRSAKDYAERLSVHVNYLNKALKENTGKTTTEVIGNRVVQEAKMLLKQTDWSVSEIAHCLGFEEISYFSGFFKKQALLTPLQFRS
ncbi:helix-turn-helix transcriptional regulator [Mucilaginibacter sp. KACC 22773]|uniref:helix-turn-helix domain-containing protein n=1 Tax=Mucilaginibacter sp. KACC 22773 TaxID=3025671 RepID=UPI002366964D|nr:helix-turn-helix transcriptional regulator [Mucilaginibacter sp. KACC 22773]WDF81144.1 helix-turn-helix transcriptional regulator [Mucilaginibacter sp. KACC 22773]